MIEGIALYLESLKKHDGFYTLGGFESERLQYARYRAISDKFYIPLSELVPLGRHELQQDSRLRRLYSQAAGLTHFLMDGENAQYRDSVIDMLRRQYEGKDNQSMLADLTKTSLERLDEGYRDFLKVTDDDMATLVGFRGIRKLALGNTQVTDAGLKYLIGQSRLDWLDVTNCQVTDAGIAALSEELPLRQLNLEGTQVSDASLSRVGGWPLVELDLSRTGVTDAGMLELSRLSELSILWLTGTEVTNRGLERLSRLSKLKHLDINRTGVTSTAWQKFRRDHPTIK